MILLPGGATLFQPCIRWPRSLTGSDGRLTLSGWLLKQLDLAGFSWPTKNLLWDELNVLKRKLNVKIKKTI